MDKTTERTFNIALFLIGFGSLGVVLGLFFTPTIVTAISGVALVVGLPMALITLAGQIRILVNTTIRKR